MKLKNIIAVVLINLIFINNAFAFSNCQFKYDNDKRSLPSLRGKCSVCHISPNGAGPQNEFGRAFGANGFKITDDLVKRFPNFFQKSNEESQPTPTAENPALGGSPPLSTLQAPPTIKRIKPNKIKANIQSMISILGQNFVNGSKAIIDGNETLTIFKSNVLVIIDIVLNKIGMHEIKVKNPDNKESNSVKLNVIRSKK